MLDVNQTKAGVATPWLATLQHGTRYVLVDLVFDKGQPVPVSDDVRSWLEDHATEERLRFIDPDDGSAEIEHRQMFSFAENPTAGGQP